METKQTKSSRQAVGDYYVGLDIGTDSVGFAATDKEYRLLRHGGNSIWGVRLFDEGLTAADRRMHRVARRRLSRRNQRLHLLRELFDTAITEKDVGFFARMDESFLHPEDKSGKAKYALFADRGFTDKDYHRTYPTVYHLRRELIENPAPHDVRLVYLALHHIMKSRGHFLEEIGGAEKRDFDELWKDIALSFSEALQLEIRVSDMPALKAVLQDTKLGKRERATKLKQDLLCFEAYEGDERSAKLLKKIEDKLCAFLAGSKVKLCDLFGVEELEGSAELSMGAQEREDVCDAAEDLSDPLHAAFSLYDALRLETLLKDYTYVCQEKCAEYEAHKADVKMLKRYVKEVLGSSELYKRIFVLKAANSKKPLHNYAAYSGYKLRGTDKEISCTSEQFCDFLKKELGTEPKDPAYAEMFERICDGHFASKLRTSANGIFPNGLYLLELNAILKNAERYLPFLSERDENGLSVSDKIRSLLSFRIPYYVGPLSGKNSWASRQEGKVFPWNFEQMVDLPRSAESFITRMTSLCTYTGDPVLPKDSLLYSAYAVLNEINCITVGGHPIQVQAKQRLYEELFVNSDRPVTKKKIKEFLQKNFGASAEDEIGGVDDKIKASLSSLHKMRPYLPILGTELAEEVIRRIALFGEDKRMLTRWLSENTSLSEEDIRAVSRFKFREWGRLSRAFLAEIPALSSAETGEAKPLIHLLWENNETMMQILYRRGLKEAADAYRADHYSKPDTLRAAVEDLYVSPKIRRSIWQTLRILDEIVDVRRAAPQKIFLEMARDTDNNGKKGKRTSSRKEQLLALYRSCKMESDELGQLLLSEDPERLRQDKYYLFYAQFGQCMYSGKPIDPARLADNGLYDIDHIFPRSKIKDDSLCNRVLVYAEENREKEDSYPIRESIRTRMYPFWKRLLDRGAISKRKFDRLVRHAELTPDELSEFVNRQLVETRQSSKAVAGLLELFLPNTRVVYSKAGNVSDFRHEFGLVKNRSVNDHHHAKDAYLNIVVGNFFHTRFTGEFWKYPRSYTVNPQRMYLHDVEGAWVAEADNTGGTIDTVKKVMAKNNVLYTRQPRTVGGALYDLQPLKAGHGQIPLKKNLPIERYGGYNKATGAYYALIEYTKKGKAVRSLEAIFAHERAAYESDPAGYARRRFGKDTQVILPRILIDALFEIDGARMNIRGRTNDNIIYLQAYQLAIDEPAVVSFLRIEKYLEKCKLARTELPILGIHQITREENLRLYRLLRDKCTSGVYKKCFSSFGDFLTEKESAFLELSLFGQCTTLMEILKITRCTAEYPNVEALGGPKKTGILCLSKRISSRTSAYLIHQSVTGLFEYKTDLLHCEPMPYKK